MMQEIINELAEKMAHGMNNFIGEQLEAMEAESHSSSQQRIKAVHKCPARVCYDCSVDLYSSGDGVRLLPFCVHALRAVIVSTGL